ncbi:Uu.00g111600.m01.CDS01 [Anthostomella pinea]|uniref:Uu.00g111600.m01.CDS01 n=1 Tax=Anthostomella pinea TaxID=933095 RepID=A0AAI8YGI3_9PEZI|nr:Uu.00g111600.m01.CDS01 [Anthostomella pinea]
MRTQTILLVLAAATAAVATPLRETADKFPPLPHHTKSTLTTIVTSVTLASASASAEQAETKSTLQPSRHSPSDPRHSHTHFPVHAAPPQSPSPASASPSPEQLSPSTSTWRLALASASASAEQAETKSTFDPSRHSPSDPRHSNSHTRTHSPTSTRSPVYATPESVTPDQPTSLTSPAEEEDQEDPTDELHANACLNWACGGDVCPDGYNCRQASKYLGAFCFCGRNWLPFQ